MRGAFSILLCFFASVLVLGCADGSDAPPGDPDAGPLPVNQCLGTTDQEIIASLLPDGGLAPGAFGGVMLLMEDCARTDCVQTIIEAGDVVGCMNTCLDGTAAGGLSAPCRTCGTEAITCGQMNCVVACVDTATEGCATCMETHCLPRQRACSGLESY